MQFTARAPEAIYVNEFCSQIATAFIYMRFLQSSVVPSVVVLKWFSSWFYWLFNFISHCILLMVPLLKTGYARIYKMGPWSLGQINKKTQATHVYKILYFLNSFNAIIP